MIRRPWLLVTCLLLPTVACALLSPAPELPADPLGHRILFAAQDVQVAPGEEAKLQRIVDHLKQHPEVLLVRVAGHADVAEADEEHGDLDRRRARAVVDRLVALGVAPERLAVARYGTSRPVDNAGSEAARQRNRRVELRAVEVEEKSGPGLVD